MSCLPFITSGPQVCKGVYGEKNLDTPQALLLSTLTFIGQYYRTVLQDSITGQYYRTVLQDSITGQYYRTQKINSMVCSFQIKERN